MSKVYEWARKFQSGRSARAKESDGRRQAKTTFGTDLTNKEYGVWKKNPGRYDIVGIDTPDSSIPTVEQKVSVVDDVPKDDVPKTDDVPEIKRTRTKRKKRSGSKNGMEYSASWYQKLPWKTDPVRASRMAAEAMAIENVEDTSEMKAYLEDSAYDEIDDDYGRDNRSIARAYHRKMWEEMRAQELYENGMYSEKPESETEGKPKPKKKPMTKTQKRDLRDGVALGVSAAGLGLSVASLMMTLSPKEQADLHSLSQLVYDHLRFMDPKGLKSDFGRTEDKAVEAIGRQLLDKQGAETLAKRITATGGKGSRTLAKRIREFSQS